MSDSAKKTGSRWWIVAMGVTCLFAVQSYPVWANPMETRAAGNPGSFSNFGEDITAEGKARLAEGGDVLEARARALEDAEQEAMLDAVRPLVHPVVFSRERAHLLKILMPRKGEVFGAMEIMAEGMVDGDTVGVQIRARVKREPIEDILAKGVHAKRLVVVLTEEANPKGSGRHVFVGEFASAARKKGYEIADLGGPGGDRWRMLMGQVRRGDREAVRRLCVYALAGAIVEGDVRAAFSEETKEIYSSRASGSISVRRVGGTVRSFTARDVKGFGSNGRKSCIDATQKASMLLSSKAVKSLPGRQKKA
jgi:hypothetical protein